MNVLGAVVEDTNVGNLKYREKKIIEFGWWINE